MGVGVCLNNVHLPCPSHDFHADLREFLHNIQDCRGGLGTFQGGMAKNTVGGEIIEQRAVAGDCRQRQRNIPQRCTDGFRRTAGGHRKPSAHADKQADNGTVAFRDTFLGRQQSIVHIAKDQIIMQVPFHLRCSFLRRVRYSWK